MLDLYSNTSSRCAHTLLMHVECNIHSYRAAESPTRPCSHNGSVRLGMFAKNEQDHKITRGQIRVSAPTIHTFLSSTCSKLNRFLTFRWVFTNRSDTTDLSIRVGLHSGPVTAGVLRGQKSRFQLFGDTGMLHCRFILHLGSCTCLISVS